MQASDLHVNGFTYGAIKSGIRGKDRLDLALIYSEEPANAAAVFTNNLVKAAPVLLGIERLANNRLQAVLINAGIANACTGDEGMVNARACTRQLAKVLEIAEDDALVSSTGVIGMQLEMGCFEKGIPAVAGALDRDNGPMVAEAIMTTDTVPKSAMRKIAVTGGEITVAAIVKGAGMIMPDMATMLCFIMTDASIDPALLNPMLKTAVDLSFNRITVDGDSSTNDTVLLMASGKSQCPKICSLESEDGSQLQSALNDLCLDLAKQVVADGEGATKLITVMVKNALSEQEAEQAARTIANSALVKTAFFGQDANWGRIIGALGRCGAQFDQLRVDIFFDQVLMVENGLGLGAEAEEAATAVLQQDEFSVTIDLKAGAGSAVVYTCDFSIDYVKINADYRT